MGTKEILNMLSGTATRCCVARQISHICIGAAFQPPRGLNEIFSTHIPGIGVSAWLRHFTGDFDSARIDAQGIA